MRRYQIKLVGKQPLLLHNDDIEWADAMDKWRADKDNQKESKAGDDRSPAWRWLGHMYHDGAAVIIPVANVMRCLMEAGAMVPVPGAKHGKTFKSQSQSGIMPTSIGWPIIVDGKTVDYAALSGLVGNKDFEAHKKAALAAGFELFVKRAKIGSSKHVRVRPRFDRWSISGELVVVDDQITTAILADIFDSGGRYKGLCDWRPGGKTPGSFGMFEATVKEA